MKLKNVEYLSINVLIKKCLGILENIKLVEESSNLAENFFVYNFWKLMLFGDNSYLKEAY